MLKRNEQTDIMLKFFIHGYGELEPIDEAKITSKKIIYKLAFRNNINII